MFNPLHNFDPNPILFSCGFINIYWYGFFVVLGFIFAFFVILFLAKRYNIKRDDVIDLCFYLFVFGIIGARIYDIFLEWRYYLENPVDILKIWQGGLAIHGAILAGIIVIIIFIKKKKNFFINEPGSFIKKVFKTIAIIVPGLAIGQAIGRWGNYFNQELFGRPTDGWWGIFINPVNRPIEYLSSSFFQPTFFYESLGCLLIFVILISVHLIVIKKSKSYFKSDLLIIALYFILYSVLRFVLEFVRIDFAPVFLGLRWPQVMSLLFIFVIVIFSVKICLDKSYKKYK